MVDHARKVVYTLLELNVLNLQNIERELKKLAARAIHPQVKNWVMTVARNYIVNLTDSEVESEYEVYTPKRKKGVYSDMPEPDQLPSWAQAAIGRGDDLHFFNPAQPRRRQLWQTVENIVDWFNTFPKDDPAINRLDRISFKQAQGQANTWRKEIDKNPWQHIKDRPQVYKEYGDGMKWVKMSSDMHLKREGQLMGHCIGGGSYTSGMRAGTSEFFSLRDSQNNPHITVETRVRGDVHEVYQMKGKQNGKAIAKYQPYLRDLVTQPGWRVVSDQDKVDL
jgi:hypothetical protein